MRSNKTTPVKMAGYRLSPQAAAQAGAWRTAIPARRYRARMSDGQNSKTSSRVLSASKRQARRPVCLSMRTARCTLDTLIGDTPGINQAFSVRGQWRPGKSPVAAQTAFSIFARYTGHAARYTGHVARFTPVMLRVLHQSCCAQSQHPGNRRGMT